MIKFIIFIFLAGCAFSRSSSYMVSGENLKTHYGTGDAVINVTANTEISLF
jgi:hypothetical protein